MSFIQECISSYGIFPVLLCLLLIAVVLWQINKLIKKSSKKNKKERKK